YDLIPSRMVGQCNAACQCHEITGAARRIEPGKFCAGGEIVQGQLIASGDSGDLRCLSECIQTRQRQSETGTAYANDKHGNLPKNHSAGISTGHRDPWPYIFMPGIPWAGSPPMARTSYSTFTVPAFSNTSVALIWSPAASGFFKPTNMTWNEPGL